MAFSQQELDIISYGKANGKTKEDVQDALTRLRTGRPYNPQPEQPATPSDNPISQAASAGVEKFKQGMSQAQGPQITDAIAGGTKAGAGAAEIAFSPLAPLFKPVAEAFSKLTDFLGGTKPVQVAAESIPEGGTTEKALDYLADTGAIAGTLAGVKSAPAAIESTLIKAARGAEHLGSITKIGLEGISEAKASSQIPGNIMQRVARVSKSKQANFEKAAGQPIGQYLVDRGIFGNVDQITEQLFARFTRSRDTADAAIAKLDGSFKYTPIKTALDELMAREAKVSTPGATSPEFRTIRELANKYNSDGLTMKQINTVKRIYERNVRLGYLKENKQDSIARATNIDSAIRKWQSETASKLGLKNLPDINKETRLAKQLLDDLGAEYAGSAGNNAITLTDWIMLSGGDPTAAAGFLTKKFMSSKAVMSSVAEKLAPAPKNEVIAPITSNLDFISSYGDWIRSLEGKGDAAATALPTATAGQTTQQLRPQPGIKGQPPLQSILPRKSDATPLSPIPTAPVDAAATKAISKKTGGVPSPTTAPKPSKAANTSTGNAPTDKTAGSKPATAMSGGGKGGPPNAALLDTLTDKQRAAFNAGSPEEQAKALDHLRLKYDLENNDAMLAKMRSPSIPKDLEPLAAEARKYKSAEEFVSDFKKKTANRNKYAGGDRSIFNKNVSSEDRAFLDKIMTYLQSDQVEKLYKSGKRDPEILIDLWHKANGK